MIVTFTANPSLDRTAELDRPLARGEVHRVVSFMVEDAGKGVNVARVLSDAGQPVKALLPAHPHDPILSRLAVSGLPHEAIAITGSVRTNLTLTEADGTTTKINEPGPTLTAEQVEACTARVLEAAEDADWVVLSGSLPPGAPVDWYAQLAAALRASSCKVAVDTSDAPLQALIDALPESSFDFIKPNSEELAQLTGGDAKEFERAALQGDPRPVAKAARQLMDRGIGAVLVTLGSAGAVLVTEEGSWYAPAPDVPVRSTVGAGDSAVAGYLLSAVTEGTPAERLCSAVAYGSAAAGLPGTSLPKPGDAHPGAITAIPIH